MSICQQRAWIEEYQNEEIKKQKKIMLNIAEVINYAYVGSQPKKKGQSAKGQQTYARWRKQLVREIYPEMKKNERSIWDRLRKKGKSQKFR